MGTDSLEVYFLETGIMKTGGLLVAMSVRFLDGVEFVTAHVRPAGTEQVQEIDLPMTVREFQHRFADSLVLLTWRGQGALERAMSTLKPA
jgi:hypothetical protein